MKFCHLHDITVRGEHDAVRFGFGAPVDLDRVLTLATDDRPAVTVGDALGALADGLLDAPPSSDAPVSASPDDAPGIMEPATSHDEK